MSKYFNILVSTFLIVLISYGCGKEQKEILVEEERSLSDRYVSSIQQRTSLIKSVKMDTTYTPVNGLEERYVSYVNAENESMSVHFLTVDLAQSNLSMEVATPFDEPDFKLQTVRNMIGYKNATRSSAQVAAAVNGDYWDVNTPGIAPGTPLGLVYKKGQMIKDLPLKNYYFLALLQDGTAVIGDELKYRSIKSTIKEALGGRYFLVNNGRDISANLNKNIEPRTAVGILEPDKVVFVIVDGRRAGFSAGISMQNLAKLFSAIGATYAINLDGGGSTTYLLKDGKGEYKTRNNPSGNSERAVANAWTIVNRN